MRRIQVTPEEEEFLAQLRHRHLIVDAYNGGVYDASEMMQTLRREYNNPAVGQFVDHVLKELTKIKKEKEFPKL